MDIIRMKRKTISVAADENGNLTVKIPFYVSDKAVEDFLDKHKRAIEKMSEAAKRRKERLSSFSNSELLRRAEEILPSRYEYFSHITGLSAASVKVTSAKTRYGSCSSKGRICFSKYLFSFSEEIIDYVILHEIAHLKFMNHSAEFYGFIERYMPDYRERVKKLNGDYDR